MKNYKKEKIIKSDKGREIGESDDSQRLEWIHHTKKNILNCIRNLAMHFLMESYATSLLKINFDVLFLTVKVPKISFILC